MGDYWKVMLDVVLPILITILFGILLQKWRQIDVRSLADVSLYVLAPSLVLISLDESNRHAPGVWIVVCFTLLHTLLSWGAAWLTSAVFRFRTESTVTLSLTTIFGNANNYGLPVLLLAYGKNGFSLGINYVIMQIILVNTLGLYLAARSQVSVRQAITQIAKTPLLYAVMVGIVLLGFGIVLPKGVSNGLHLMGNAYPAVVILILGTQLRKISIKGLKRKDVWISVGLRVIAVPILSELSLIVLGINGLLASVLFVQSSMPAAINTSVLVEKYGGDKELVTATIAITTLISFLTLPYFIHIGVH